ncbi:hypothetical protein H9P43_003296 [Blastocladiella emersonii ATCC 22665]|nr:hypothetical protein H9P43_003296 [Blastocladiella emersonii ATCC 22665]
MDETPRKAPRLTYGRRRTPLSARSSLTAFPASPLAAAAVLSSTSPPAAAAAETPARKLQPPSLLGPATTPTSNAPGSTPPSVPGVVYNISSDEEEVDPAAAELSRSRTPLGIRALQTIRARLSPSITMTGRSSSGSSDSLPKPSDDPFDFGMPAAPAAPAAKAAPRSKPAFKIPRSLLPPSKPSAPPKPPPVAAPTVARAPSPPAAPPALPPAPVPPALSASTPAPAPRPPVLNSPILVTSSPIAEPPAAVDPEPAPVRAPEFMAPTSRPASASSSLPLESLPGGNEDSQTSLLGGFFDSDEEDASTPTGVSPGLMTLPPVGIAAITSGVALPTPRASKKRKLSSSGIATPSANPHTRGNSQTSDDADIFGFGYGEVRTLHEMREAGESRRVQEDAQYLLDGLRPHQPAGLRRHSALDVVRKMADAAHRRALAVHNAMNQLLEALASDPDPFLVRCFLLLAHTLQADTETAKMLSRERRLKTWLFLPHMVDLLVAPDFKPEPRDKKSINLFNQLAALVQASPLPPWVSASPNPARSMWLLLSHATLSQAMDVAGAAHLSSVLEQLLDLVAPLSYASWTPDQQLALSLIELASFVSGDASDHFARRPGFVESLVALATSCHRALLAAEPDADAVPHAALYLTLCRLAINVTHGTPAAASAMAGSHDFLAGVLDVLTHASVARPAVWAGVRRDPTGVRRSPNADDAGSYSQQHQPRDYGSQAHADQLHADQATDRANPRLVAVGLLLNLAETCPADLGPRVAAVDGAVAALAGLIHDAPSVGDDDDDMPGLVTREQVHREHTTAVVRAFAAVILAVALHAMPAAERAVARGESWRVLGAQLEQFLAYQDAGDGEEAGGGGGGERAPGLVDGVLLPALATWE